MVFIERTPCQRMHNFHNTHNLLTVIKMDAFNVSDKFQMQNLFSGRNEHAHTHHQTLRTGQKVSNNLPLLRNKRKLPINENILFDSRSVPLASREFPTPKNYFNIFRKKKKLKTTDWIENQSFSACIHQYPPSISQFLWINKFYVSNCHRLIHHRLHFVRLY